MNENEIVLDIWEKLKNLRKESWLTQLELSEKSWVARSYISDIEKGKAKITYSKLVIILDTLWFSLEINKKKQK